MTNKVRYSKDPKIQLVSVEKFLADNDYFRGGIPKWSRWTVNTVPAYECTYYKICEDKLISIYYRFSPTNFGMNEGEKLDLITVALRNGKAEYEAYDAEIERLRSERAKYKKSARLDKLILETERAKKRLPKYVEKPIPQQSNRKIGDFIVDTGCKTARKQGSEKYVVFDVETNGTRKSNDDLLSLSIYDPYTGLCYNRFFPLDLQPVILTGHINGIDDDTLTGTTHLTQSEMDEIIDFFDLKNTVLLSYSGGQGMDAFDPKFVINYCKRHEIIGFDQLHFENIKQKLPPAPFESQGKLTKDNLCKMLGIEGVADIHSGINDCILEWKLFEKLVSEPVFFVGNSLYRFNKDYIIPISYAVRYPRILKLAGVKCPFVLGYPDTVFEYSFPKNIVKKLKKFPTNITGITIENAINSMLKVEKQDNYEFLAQNRNKLDYLGSLDSNFEKIPIIEKDNGLISTLDSEFVDYVSEINKVTKVIMSKLSPTIDFIKNNIFSGSKILSQEMVISDDRKVLALCDLSSDKSVLEIKTMDIVMEDQYGKHLPSNVSLQLYYQKRGRDVFTLSLMFDTIITDSFERKLNGVSLKIYKVELREVEAKPAKYVPTGSTLDILKELIKDNKISYGSLIKKTGYSQHTIQKRIAELKEQGYIAREGQTCGYWKILKDGNGNLTADINKPTNSNESVFSDIYKKNVLKMTGGLIHCLKYTNSKEKADYKCRCCGYEWSVRPDMFISRQHHSCPKCKAGESEK